MDFIKGIISISKNVCLQEVMLIIDAGVLLTICLASVNMTLWVLYDKMFDLRKQVVISVNYRFTIKERKTHGNKDLQEVTQQGQVVCWEGGGLD